ncbi:nitrate reductase molybdenum cofactor assembly chaperone [Virgibacillus profundi]|uniref:Nitrate reductase molybdenum cofactor assembly chaperone n=1 Tax=Virgibacillus profundi TaxID=2024555 RepID=A0A2A2IDU8_9BACI|nr:nitrate reductase molybdenum cofactor assembly chaperone [Virgibacillus profundi]PAV29434.1 nitrate reductase molybdenum cofactor assembly chaperone [Virgibacillus profundi]PXY53603.1 nitrate reductase molybdenum cofactor assembly chaperone [Virgibacillus profundi]
MKAHQKVYKITSIFLQYPQKEWYDFLPEIKSEIATIENPTANAYLTSFMYYLESTPFDQLCERYVKTFDFHGITTLYLTYNVFKDSRERGEALVKLRQLVTDSNLETETEELPDYLPMILEFLSAAEDKYVQRMLKLHAKSILKLDQDLVENDSDYHFLLKATIEISNEMMRNAKVS